MAGLFLELSNVLKLFLSLISATCDWQARKMPIMLYFHTR